MSSEWRSVQLGECAELDTGFPFKSAHYAESLNAVRLLRGDNIGQGQLRWDGVKGWLRKDGDALATFELRENDLVLAMDRPWITVGLKFARVRKSDLPALLVQRVARLRPKSGVDVDYLHYVVASPAFTQHIQNVTTGTAVPHISAKQIREYKFHLPDLATQQAYGKALMSIDDRIFLLRETNRTLEAIAQALFKSWFVDTEPVRAKLSGCAPECMDAATAALFSDRFEESEVGLVPKGWRVCALDEIALFLNGLAMQKYPPTEDSWLPVIKIAQLRKGDTNGADRAGRNIKPEYFVQNGDVLFSWSGSLEVEIWCGGEGALNQHLFKVTSNTFPKWFYYLWTKHHLEDFRQIAASKATTMGHIQRRHLSQAKVLVPPDELIVAIGAFLAPLFERFISTALQVQSLTVLRDTLLPRLISGQLGVSEAGAIVEKVAA